MVMLRGTCIIVYDQRCRPGTQVARWNGVNSVQTTVGFKRLQESLVVPQIACTGQPTAAWTCKVEASILLAISPHRAACGLHDSG